MLTKWLTGDGTWPYPHPTTGWARYKFLLRIFWTGQTPPIPQEVQTELREKLAQLEPEMRSSMLDVIIKGTERRRDSMTENANKGNFATGAIVGTIAPLLVPTAVAASGRVVNPLVWVLAVAAITLNLVALQIIVLSNSPKSKANNRWPNRRLLAW